MVEDVDPLDRPPRASCPGLRGATGSGRRTGLSKFARAYIRGRPDDNGAAAMPTAPTVFCRRRYAGRMPQHRRRPKVRSALPISATEVHETISSERRRPAAATTRRSTSWAPTGRSSSPPHYAKPLPPRYPHNVIRCGPSRTRESLRLHSGHRRTARSLPMAPIYQVTDRLHEGRTVHVPCHEIGTTVSAWLAELGAQSQLVEELARAVGADDWPTAYAIGDRLSVEVTRWARTK